MSKKKKSFNELMAKSSIGAGLADIKARGIDAHAADLAREMKPLFKSRVEREDHDRLTTARALEVSRKALIERCRKALIERCRRLDRDLADLRKDLDRLQNFD